GDKAVELRERLRRVERWTTGWYESARGRVVALRDHDSGHRRLLPALIVAVDLTRRPLLVEPRETRPGTSHLHCHDGPLNHHADGADAGRRVAAAQFARRVDAAGAHEIQRGNRILAALRRRKEPRDDHGVTAKTIDLDADETR